LDTDGKQGTLTGTPSSMHRRLPHRMREEKAFAGRCSLQPWLTILLPRVSCGNLLVSGKTPRASDACFAAIPLKYAANLGFGRHGPQV
jgi:hypothetical protein